MEDVIYYLFVLLAIGLFGTVAGILEFLIDLKKEN